MNPVAGTNDSSTASKVSMVDKGYFPDPFIRAFVGKAYRRTSIIHRGYFCRVWAIDQLISIFIKQMNGSPFQIISLGAGFDTLYLRLKKGQKLQNCQKIIEIDFPAVINQKLRLMERSNLAFENNLHIQRSSEEKADVMIDDIYHLISADLTNTAGVEKKLRGLPDMSFDLPTFVLSECVLTYLDSVFSDTVIESMGALFQNSCFLLYEQVIPYDGFGKIMRKHFDKIDSSLKTIQKYPTRRDVEKRLSLLGYNSVYTATIGELYHQTLSPSERTRIAEIEPFDEFEVWDSKAAHYLVSMGNNIPSMDEHFKIFLKGIGIKSKNELQSPNRKSMTLLPKGTDSTTQLLSRFGHASTEVIVDNQKFLIVSGGFGSVSGRHGKCKSIVAFNAESGEAKEVKFAESRSDLERMYHQMVTFGSKRNKVVLVGGRASPTKPLQSHFSFKLRIDSDGSLVAERIDEDFEFMPLARWRFASCAINGSTIFYCGGLSVGGKLLQDSYVVDLNQKTIRKAADLPSPLHSHRCNLWTHSDGQQRIIVSGGLSDFETTVSEKVYAYDLKSDSWTVLNENWTTSDHLQCSRYGHSSHIKEDSLYLVGGSHTTHPNLLDAMLRIGLSDGSVESFHFDEESNDESPPIMLVNHTSFVSDSGNICSVGGGGNCFGFGTLFNPPVQSISVAQG